MGLQSFAVDEDFATETATEGTAATMQPHVDCEGGGRAEEPVAHAANQLRLQAVGRRIGGRVRGGRETLRWGRRRWWQRGREVEGGWMKAWSMRASQFPSWSSCYFVSPVCIPTSLIGRCAQAEEDLGSLRGRRCTIGEPVPLVPSVDTITGP